MSMPIMVTGQFGEVYRAQMGKTTVALKIIKKYASEKVFEREMSIMAQVTHNNIVTLHGIIREGHTTLTYSRKAVLNLNRSAFTSVSDGIFTTWKPKDVFVRKSLFAVSIVYSVTILIEGETASGFPNEEYE